MNISKFNYMLSIYIGERYAIPYKIKNKYDLHINIQNRGRWKKLGTSEST